MRRGKRTPQQFDVAMHRDAQIYVTAGGVFFTSEASPFGEES